MCGKILRTCKQIDSAITQSRTPCIDDHQFKEEEKGSVGEVSNIMRSTCFEMPVFGSKLVDWIFLWSVNKLARSVTKWTRACDKRSARLISYIHHTIEFKQYCHVGNTAQQCGKILILPVT